MGKRYSFFESVFYWVSAFGLNPQKLLLGLRGFPATMRDFVRLTVQRKRRALTVPLRFSMPCPDDRYLPSGKVPRHYFHQDLYVARKVFEDCPSNHVDIGSRIDGFVAHVAAFRAIEVFDIRPQDAVVPNVKFRQVDLTQLSNQFENYCDSLSCLHALEHFGLGRYGDRPDLEAYKAGFENMAKLLKAAGTFYLSVPIGPERIEFNAHRVFDIKTILQLTSSQFSLISFSYIDDTNVLHPDVQLQDDSIQSNYGCHYGCGIFVLKKKTADDLDNT